MGKNITNIMAGKHCINLYQILKVIKILVRHYSEIDIWLGQNIETFLLTTHMTGDI